MPSPDSSVNERSGRGHEDPVTDARQVLVLGARDEHRHAVGRELLQQVEDRVLRADVDPLGGLIEQQHLRLCEQPFPKQRLPPVATAEALVREVGPPRPDVELLHHLDHPLPLLGRP